jgi:nucleotide-binding universal stress UspA family protein
LELASRHGAEITGFTSVDTERIALQVPKAVGYYSYHVKEIEGLVEAARSEADGAIEELRAVCGKESIPFKSASASAQGEANLSAVWRFHDVCVIPMHLWLPGADRLASSDSILRLVMMGLRPLIAVPKEIPAVRPSKVLVALSGSLESAKALKHFLQLQLYPGVAMHLVTVGNPKSGETSQELLDQAAEFLEAHGHPVTSACLEEAEDRVAALLGEADRAGAEMFVIGSSYKKLLMMKRFGKHALGLLERSNLPVFISH